MKIAEIKVSYTNKNPIKVKVSNSQIAYDCVLEQWDKDILEFQEEFKIVLLNKANVILGVYEMSKGGISGTVVDIKIILSVALKCHSSGIILVHNHPSGNLTPSDSDRALTRKLKDACNLIELSLLDHLVITKESYFSFADEGIL